jgi:hypothetical protein
MTATPRGSARDAGRWLSDLYCLWRCCGKRACRRARACCGSGRTCLQALPLVPAEALDFLEGYDEGLREGLSFDEMMARNEEEWQAIEDWRAVVMST